MHFASLCVLLVCVLNAACSKVYRRITNEELIYSHVFGRQLELSAFPLCLLDYEADDGNDTVRLVSELDMQAEQFQTELLKRGISALNVEIGLSIIQLVAVSEREQTMTLSVRTYTDWTDCRLAWSPADFNKVYNITVPPERFRSLNVFQPLIILLEDTNPLASQGSELSIRVTSGGGISVHREYTSTVSCALHVEMYPFDSHSCNLTFETPFSSLETNLKYTLYDSVDAESRFLLADGRFIPSDTWEVTMLPPVKNRRWTCSDVNDTGVDERNLLSCSVDRLTFRMLLRRHPDYQVVNLFIPGFLCIFISAFVFLIPPGRTDKFFLMFCILLSLFIFLNIMYAKMPETGFTVPLMSHFYFACTIFVSVCCVLCSVTTTIAAGRTAIPRTLINLVLCFPFLLIEKAPEVCNIVPQSESKSDEKLNTPCQIESDLANKSQRAEKRRTVKWQAKDVSWVHVSWFFDLVFMVMVLLLSVSILVYFLVYGYNALGGPYKGRLSEADWAYVYSQLTLQGDSTHANS